ncbi:MAG: polysaccharide deacetylase [Clostridiales bacterium]|jgi:peptidoglycan/xylan/chitin deacetylase (PgdA/CDA1 family)|nr:polysaccharide deacetylase [Eubacteriales bacterium]MDH7566047.1 polysaccharide deacetylase [Clostridiales bacterium]
MSREKNGWKCKKDCAVAVTINLDGEYFWLSMFPDSVNKPKTLSMGTFGLKRGLDRILDTADRFNIPCTFFVPGKIAETYPQKILEIAKRGHEIANHGYAHENFSKLTLQEQRESLIKCNEAVERICGKKPVGFRAPEGELTKETLKLLYDSGFLYSSSLYNDDRPYFIELDGKTTDLVEIPLQWQLSDFPYFAFNYSPAFPAGQGRIANYTQVLNNWKYEFTGYANSGLAYVLQLDPQTIGTPGRIGLLEELLEFITSSHDVWFCTCSELARSLKR